MFSLNCFHFLKLLSSFCSDWVIYTTMFSIWQVHSFVSSYLLLIPCSSSFMLLYPSFIFSSSLYFLPVKFLIVFTNFSLDFTEGLYDINLNSLLGRLLISPLLSSSVVFVLFLCLKHILLSPHFAYFSVYIIICIIYIYIFYASV